MRPQLEKSFMKIGLVEWFKVKALSSSNSTEKKRNELKSKYNVFLIVFQTPIG
jgi:hypothetical protein